ncbi:fungal protein [Schizosaccharomyces japonicus yFS275]|uniref:Fungal protein n=1 Tax=Schizosaccharomyces japonicus (strain yFS275 / FY16936) TaxID=402676 RepID=B6JZ08_SCHJY|nr:fungal protein [Schizosaccharomyces japonicus yFS275]EEB06776.2 fungal protein [Schizosaccharomyces japonicus yFS275]
MDNLLTESVPTKEHMDENVVMGDVEVEGTAKNELDQPATEEVQIRRNALHLIGLTDLSQNQVSEFVTEYFSEPKCVFEWVNDDKCNLVYPDDDVCRSALFHLVNESIEDMDERRGYQTKPHPSLQKVFSIRLATTLDKKVSNAHVYSRYYLLHGDPREDSELRRHQRQKNEGKSNSVNTSNKGSGKSLAARLGPKVSDLSLAERISRDKKSRRRRRRRT